MARKQFQMSVEQKDKLLKAMAPTPAIMLQCGPAPSLQERANAAWAELGKEMGFHPMSVMPVAGADATFFTAEAIDEVKLQSL